MRKLHIGKKDVFTMLGVSIVGFIFIIWRLSTIGNLPQKYDGYIIETIASNGSNKSGEMNLFWMLLFGGIILIVLISKVLIRKEKFNIEEISNSSTLSVKTIIIIMLIANLGIYIILGKFSGDLLGIIGLLLVYYLVIPNFEIEGMIFSIFIFYDLVAISYITYLICNIQINQSIILIISMIVSAVLTYYFRKKRSIYRKVMLISQLFLPIILLVFLGHTYSYDGKEINISLRIREYILFLCLEIILLFFMARHIKKQWIKVDKLEIYELISLTSCIVIASFNILTGTMQYITPDIHHPAESIIAFQQIFGFKQIPYENYFPVSGMFPLVLGGILKLLGGEMTYYYMAANVFCMLIAAIIIYLCSQYVNKLQCLIISAIFIMAPLTLFVRTYLILPTILTLALPKLIKNKSMWLQVWIILCLLGGMYYPLYGVATLVGSLPFGIIQFISFVKSEEFKEKVKNPIFYFTWILVIGVVGVFIPIIINMVKHVFVYSSQSILADGIAVFGQSVPSTFMPYLTVFEGIRIACYYSIRFLLPALVVWLFVLFLIKLLNSKNEFKKNEKSQLFLLATFGALALIVSYTYTIIREDVGLILSRTTNVITPLGLILVFIICIRYIKDSSARNIILGMCITVCVILEMSGLDSINNKLKYKYDVPDNFIYISNDDIESIPNLGKGFISKNVLNEIKRYRNITNELLSYDSNLSFLGLDYEFYYVLNIKTCAQPSLGAIKSLAATKETIDVIKNEKPVIFLGFDPVMEYYLYYWLLQSNEYEYNSKYNAFLPKDLIVKIKDYENNNNKICPLLTTDCGKIANSLGKSKDTLIEKSFNQIGIVSTFNVIKTELLSKNIKKDNKKIISQTSFFVYDLSEELYGKEADFVYLKLSVDLDKNKNSEENKSYLEKKLTKDTSGEDIIVTISWDNDYNEKSINYMTCVCGDGNLIVPLGGNLNWLLNPHKQFTIKVSGLKEDSLIKVSDIKFLKSNAQTLLN